MDISNSLPKKTLRSLNHAGSQKEKHIAFLSRFEGIKHE